MFGNIVPSDDLCIGKEIQMVMVTRDIEWKMKMKLTPIQCLYDISEVLIWSNNVNNS